MPSRLQDEDVENIYDASTDKLSRGIGQLLGKSELTSLLAKRANINPVTINYLIDQYSGVIGDFALPALTPQAETNPLADRFSTSSTMKSRYPSDYYNRLNELKSNKKKSNASDEDKLLYQYLSSNRDEVSGLYKQEREIQLDENLSDEEKREQIFEIQKQINDITKNSVEGLDSLKIDGNSATIGDKTYVKDADGSWSELKKELPKDLPTNTYADYNKLPQAEKKKYKEEHNDKQMPEKEQNKLLESQNYSAKEKQLLYAATTGSNDDTYNAIKELNGGKVSNDYINYIKKSQEGYFTNTDEKTGKNVDGQKQQRVRDFLQNSDLSDIEKYYIYAKAGYACVKRGGGLTSKQRQKLRDALNNNKLNIDEETYNSMIKTLDEADANAKKWKLND